MRLDVSSDGVHVLELLLTQGTGEVLRGVYGRVVYERVLRGERVLALVAAVLLALAEGPVPSTVDFSMRLA